MNSLYANSKHVVALIWNELNSVATHGQLSSTTPDAMKVQHLEGRQRRWRRSARLERLTCSARRSLALRSGRRHLRLMRHR